MSSIAELLARRTPRSDSSMLARDAKPSRRLVILTCMDTRLDPLRIFGLEPGEAQILRNAGGRVTQDVLRSLAISANMFAVGSVIVMHHTGCGLAGFTQEQLRERTGADLDFLPIDQHDAALTEDVRMLTESPYLKGLKECVGLLYNLETDVISVLT